MQVMYQRCAGFDIHKKTVVACRITLDEQGGSHIELRTFGTMAVEQLA
jgi:transposase